MIDFARYLLEGLPEVGGVKKVEFAKIMSTHDASPEKYIVLHGVMFEHHRSEHTFHEFDGEKWCQWEHTYRLVPRHLYYVDDKTDWEKIPNIRVEILRQMQEFRRP